MKVIARLSDQVLNLVAPKTTAAALSCVPGTESWGGACGCNATWLMRYKTCLDPVQGWWTYCARTSTHC